MYACDVQGLSQASLCIFCRQLVNKTEFSVLCKLETSFVFYKDYLRKQNFKLHQILYIYICKKLAVYSLRVMPWNKTWHCTRMNPHTRNLTSCNLGIFFLNSTTPALRNQISCCAMLSTSENSFNFMLVRNFLYVLTK